MMRGEENSRDRLLWVNVLLRAIEDATAPAPLRQDTFHQREAAEERAEARAWFDLGNPDFREVCSLAGRDPEDTYEKAMAAIRQAEQKPVKQQRRDTERRYGKIYTYNGLSLTISQWAERTGIPIGVLHHRLTSPNFTVEQALTAPYRPRKVSAQPAPARTTLTRMVDGFRASKAPAFGFASFARPLP